MSKLVPLDSFSYVHEVAVLKSYLENEGISCFLENEHVLSVHPFLSAGIGGVVLKVPESEFTRAQALKEAFYRSDPYLVEDDDSPESETEKRPGNSKSWIRVIRDFLSG